MNETLLKLHLSRDVLKMFLKLKYVYVSWVPVYYFIITLPKFHIKPVVDTLFAGKPTGKRLHQVLQFLNISGINILCFPGCSNQVREFFDICTT